MTQDTVQVPATRVVPEGLKKKIFELKRIETELGHLPPESWAINELQRRTLDPDFPFHANQLEQQTELLFGDICDDLAELTFSPEQIADIINESLQYPGGPKYCNELEVQESLGLS